MLINRGLKRVFLFSTAPNNKNTEIIHTFIHTRFAKGVIHMKIICSKSNLVKGVSIVSKAVPSKTTMPILECILIDATNDIIKLTANDM